MLKEAISFMLDPKYIDFMLVEVHSGDMTQNNTYTFELRNEYENRQMYIYTVFSVYKQYKIDYFNSVKDILCDYGEIHLDVALEIVSFLFANDRDYLPSASYFDSIHNDNYNSNNENDDETGTLQARFTYKLWFLHKLQKIDFNEWYELVHYWFLRLFFDVDLESKFDKNDNHDQEEQEKEKAQVAGKKSKLGAINDEFLEYLSRNQGLKLYDFVLKLIRSYNKYEESFDNNRKQLKEDFCFGYKSNIYDKYTLNRDLDLDQNENSPIQVYNSTMDRLIESYLKYNKFNVAIDEATEEEKKEKEKEKEKRKRLELQLSKKYHFLLKSLFKHRVLHKWVYVLLSDEKPKNFDINYIDIAFGRMTYLMYAIKGNCNLDMIKFLIDKCGADKTIQDSMDQNAYQISCAKHGKKSHISLYLK